MLFRQQRRTINLPIPVEGIFNYTFNLGVFQPDPIAYKKVFQSWGIKIYARLVNSQHLNEEEEINHYQQYPLAVIQFKLF